VEFFQDNFQKREATFISHNIKVGRDRKVTEAKNKEKDLMKT